MISDLEFYIIISGVGIGFFSMVGFLIYRTAKELHVMNKFNHRQSNRPVNEGV